MARIHLHYPAAVVDAARGLLLHWKRGGGGAYTIYHTGYPTIQGGGQRPTDPTTQRGGGQSNNPYIYIYTCIHIET